MITEQRDWYDTPDYYDIIFDEDTDREADFLLQAYKLHSINRRSTPHVLEPACGSGRLMKALSDRGCDVDGFDLGEPMVQYAKRRLMDSKTKVNIWQDRMEAFDLLKKAKQYDLCHCLVSTFKYLLTEKDARSHLQKAAACLAPGGLYILGIHLTDYKTADKCEAERWTGRRGNTLVVCNTRTWPADQKTRLEDVRTRLRITVNGEQKLQETKWQFRTYNARQVKSLLRSVPELEHVASYDFTYDIHEPRALDDSYSDIILILRRR